MLRNTISSTTRITTVGKYLVALSTALLKTAEQERIVTSNGKETSIPRKQLHILYLLNDILHHTKYHNDSTSTFSTSTSILQPFIVTLFRNASTYDSNVYLKQHQRIDSLISAWEKHGYHEVYYLHSLREAVTSAGNQNSQKGQSIQPLQDSGNDPGRAKQDVPYVMPASHGESTAPYYDLPAGNLMPHIIPNSARPIDPHSVKPLQFAAGPANEGLVIAIKEFTKDVNLLYGQGPEITDGISVDIDELGQPVIRDEVMGETVEGDTYYGWSRAFCAKMKQRRNGKIAPRSRDGNDSLDLSQSPRKRRRYSSSQESRSPSRTRSDLKFQRRGPMRNQRDRSYSRSRSRSRTRSRSPLPRNHRTSRSRSRSRTRSYSPPIKLAIDRNQSSSKPLQSQAVHQVYMAVPPPPVSVPFSGRFPQGIPLGPGGLPIPPPPPPNYSGPWPPPPPPLGSTAGMFQLPGFIPPPPPPVDTYGNRPSPVPSYGNPMNQGGMPEPRDQYGGVSGYGGPSMGAGYGGYPAQGHRGGHHGGRGRGGRGGWKG